MDDEERLGGALLPRARVRVLPTVALSGRDNLSSGRDSVPMHACGRDSVTTAPSTRARHAAGRQCQKLTRTSTLSSRQRAPSKVNRRPFSLSSSLLLSSLELSDTQVYEP